jgi:hypothetical protein
MNYVLIPILVILLVMVVVSLVRGVAAFLQSTKMDLERDDSVGASEMQLRQNKMMFARVKYQALAIVVVALVIMASR